MPLFVLILTKYTPQGKPLDSSSEISNDLFSSDLYLYTGIPSRLNTSIIGQGLNLRIKK